MKANELITKTLDVRSNPARMQDVVFSVIPEMLNGEYGVVDPNNPVALMTEMGCMLSAAAMMQNEILSRNEYPILAQNFEDLYRHMSDVDFVDRFYSPASNDFTLLLALDEIIQRAVKVDDNVSIMKIPESTRITVDGMSFTLAYPIEIRVLSHGGIQVVYNTDKLNPIKTLESNIVDWDIVQFRTTGQLSNGKMLRITIPADQYRIDVFYDQLNPSTGFSKTYNYADGFYYARVWTSNEGEEWTEIKTTHSDQVYDIDVLTALLEVTDTSLKVTIPQIYFTKGISGKKIRIDIYTTKGAINTSFDSYPPDAYEVDWLDYDQIADPANEPIRSFSNKSLFSNTGIISGGSAGLTFEQLRNRVIYDSLGTIDEPITDAQLQFKLERLGYNILKDTDTITNRGYLATRALPKPDGLDFNAEIGSTVKTFQNTFESLASHSAVYDNYNRLTIKANTLFELIDGKLTLVDDSDRQFMNDLNNESLIATFNNRQFFNTLFHYVLDSTDSVFNSRPFHLNAPKIKSKEFIAENESTLLQISTQRYAIEHNDDGYKIIVVTSGSAVTKALSDDQLHVMLLFTPPGEFERAALKGNILGRTESDDFIIEFVIESNFDIDSKNRLFTNTFKMFDLSERRVPMNLETKFDIVYAVSGYSVENIRKGVIDDIIPNYMISGEFYSVLQERLDVRIGSEMEGLWSRSRTIAGPNDYKRYTSVVYNTFPEDVYEKHGDTGLDVVNLVDGKLVRNKLHSEGDFVLVDGQKTIKHNIGDPILGSDGLPIISEGRQTVRQIDLFLLEGLFSISTDPSINNYFSRTTDQIVNWINTDIYKIERKLHENTDLHFYPKNNMGQIDVSVGSATAATIDAEQSFVVKFYLTDMGYQNDDLREVLRRITKDIITTQLTKKTLSVVNVASQIKAVSNEEVISVVVSGLGGDNNYELVTVKDDDASISIKKRAIVLPDTTITIEDDIVFEWVRHGQS